MVNSVVPLLLTQLISPFSPIMASSLGVAFVWEQSAGVFCMMEVASSPGSTPLGILFRQGAWSLISRGVDRW